MRFGKALLQLEILAGLLGALPTAGADLTDAQLRSGLTQLAAMVAADVPKDARWVLVESQGRKAGIFSHQEDVFRTEGNVFLFDEKPGVEARLLFLYSGTFYTAKAEREGEGEEPSARGEREFRATWKKADVAKDVAAAAEWLKKDAQRARPNTTGNATLTIDGMMDGDGSANPLRMHQQTALFWAAVLQRTGHEAESLTLARAALANADEKRRKLLLDGCFNRRANQAFQHVMEEFNKQHDWARLQDALAGLVNQYPLGWQQRDAVRVFHHHVTERAKLPAVPPLKTTRPLTATEQQVLLAWQQELEAGKQLEYSRWTLPVLKSEEGEEDPVPQSNRAAFPRSHGLAAVPLLAALLGDETLTLVDLNRGQGMGGSYGYFGGRDEEAPKKLEHAYNALSKPLTRAQLAWNLLQRVLPSDLQRGGAENLAELAPEILAWYASLKDATPADIALAYLEAGDGSKDVMEQAMAVTDPKKFARLENTMLEQAQIWDVSKLVAFVEKLGPEKAPAFVAKVRQKLEGELSRFGSNDQGNQRKQVESGLKRLDAAAKGEKKKPDLKELLAMMAAYDEAAEDADQSELREVYEEFSKLMRKLSAAERLEMVLTVLPNFKSPSLAVNMLSFVLAGDDGTGAEKLKPEERQALLERTRPHWQRLLGAPTGESEEPLGLLIQLVQALEQLVTGKGRQNELYALSSLGDRGEAILRTRATALLAGQKVEPLPSAAAIKSDERQKMLADWSKKTAAEMTRDFETLPVDQLLALNETLQRSADLPGSFKEYVGLIQTVKIKGVADPAPWEAYRGKAWSKEMLVALAKQISSYSGGRLLVQLQRSAPLFGFKLQVSEVPKFGGNNWQVRQMAQELESAPEELGEKLPKLGKRLSAGNFQQARTGNEWGWLDAPRVEEPKEAPPDAKEDVDEEAAEMLEEMRGEELAAWQVLSKATSDANALPTSLIFISAPTAELVKKD